MEKKYGSVLWWDPRHREGQIKCEDGKKYYFNHSVWTHDLEPVSTQSVKFTVDEIGIVEARDLCGGALKIN